MKAVIFTLADKEYGVDIAQVTEVIRLRPLVPVPDAAGFVAGVTSVRGDVLPLINLRAKLGFPPKPPVRSDRIILTRFHGHPVGIIVDAVSGVLSIADAALTMPDDLLKGARYLRGVAHFGKRLILIADIEHLLGDEAGKGIADVRGRVEIRRRTTA